MIKQLFERVVFITSDVMQLKPSLVTRSKCAEYVDGRYIIVKILSEEGISDAMIAKELAMTRAAVCKIRNSFAERARNKMFNYYFQEVRKLFQNDS